MAKKNLKDRLRAKQEELKNRSKGGKYDSIKEGTTRLRPAPVPPETEFAAEVTVFYLGKKGYVVSPISVGEKCGIMEEYNRLKDSKSESDRSFASKMRPSKRFLMPHISFKDEKGKEIDTEKGVRLLMVPTSVYNELIDMYLDEEAGDFTDPLNGYDIKYKRSGKTKMDTEYTVMRCNPTKVADKSLRKPVDLDAMIKELVPSYKESKQIMEEFVNMTPDSDKEEGEDEAPKKKKKKRSL